MKTIITKLFSVACTVPASIISALFIYNYAAEATHPLIPFPQLPVETMFITIFIFDLMVVSVSIYALVKPKLWQLATPAGVLLLGAIAFVSLKPTMGEAAFIAGSIYIYVVLGISCAGFLGVGIYLLLGFAKQHYAEGGESENETKQQKIS